tara:strand:+ start:607 stop:744 length:138 start_codon:yes stop_codon:yes gene_type:complete
MTAHVFERTPGINDDEQFLQFVKETVDDDFKYSDNFTEEHSYNQS